MKARQATSRLHTTNKKHNTIQRNKRKTKRYETKRTETKEKNAHKLSFLNLFRLRRRRRSRGFNGSRGRRRQEVASCECRAGPASRQKLPTHNVCAARGFKKCRIPEAAVQSVELKNERTDRGRRLGSLGDNRVHVRGG